MCLDVQVDLGSLGNDASTSPYGPSTLLEAEEEENMASRSSAVEQPLQRAFGEGYPSYEFGVNNDPNPEILLQSLRASGYTLEAAIGDFIDNPIDAEASAILVNLGIDATTREWWIEVADNGSGMDEETLDQMMRLGSRTAHDLTRDLGAFGLGSDTAALAVGRNKHVITANEPGHWLAAMWDLDVIREKQKFIKHLGKAEQGEIKLFSDAFARLGLDVPETGTLVRISKCDQIGRTRLEPAVRSILKYVGRTYRRFLAPNGGLTIMVNGEAATPMDPLWRDHPETAILLDDAFDYSWKEDGVEQRETVSVVVANLPDFGKEANKDHGITLSNEGFYVLRNSREILTAETLGLFSRHQNLARFRAEINVPAALDSQLGVTFLKSSAGADPVQGLKDKIEQIVAPYRRQIRKLYQQSSNLADESIPHEEASKLIKARAPFLRRPAAEVPVRSGPSGTGTTPKSKSAKGIPASPRDRSRRALADLATFEARKQGVTAPFYDGWLDGKRIVVVYNADHPAYERLIIENRDNRGTVTAIDFFVYSLLAAELRNVDDEHARFMEALREDASFNLRQLLTS